MWTGWEIRTFSVATLSTEREPAAGRVPSLNTFVSVSSRPDFCSSNSTWDMQLGLVEELSSQIIFRRGVNTDGWWLRLHCLGFFWVFLQTTNDWSVWVDYQSPQSYSLCSLWEQSHFSVNFSSYRSLPWVMYCPTDKLMCQHQFLLPAHESINLTSVIKWPLSTWFRGGRHERTTVSPPLTTDSLSVASSLSYEFENHLESQQSVVTNISAPHWLQLDKHHMVGVFVLWTPCSLGKSVPGGISHVYKLWQRTQLQHTNRLISVFWKLAN